jgi:hypothetical protein
MRNGGKGNSRWKKIGSVLEMPGSHLMEITEKRGATYYCYNTKWAPIRNKVDTIL